MPAGEVNESVGAPKVEGRFLVERLFGRQGSWWFSGVDESGDGRVAFASERLWIEAWGSGKGVGAGDAAVVF